jgi:histone H3/H4
MTDKDQEQYAVIMEKRRKRLEQAEKQRKASESLRKQILNNSNIPTNSSSTTQTKIRNKRKSLARTMSTLKGTEESVMDRVEDAIKRQQRADRQKSALGDIIGSSDDESEQRTVNDEDENEDEDEEIEIDVAADVSSQDTTQMTDDQNGISSVKSVKVENDGSQGQEIAVTSSKGTENVKQESDSSKRKGKGKEKTVVKSERVTRRQKQLDQLARSKTRSQRQQIQASLSKSKASFTAPLKTLSQIEQFIMDAEETRDFLRKKFEAKKSKQASKTSPSKSVSSSSPTSTTSTTTTTTTTTNKASTKSKRKVSVPSKSTSNGRNFSKTKKENVDGDRVTAPRKLSREHKLNRAVIEAQRKGNAGIPKAVADRLIREIASQYTTREGLRFEAQAILTLKLAAESHVTELHSEAQRIAELNLRKQPNRADFLIANRIMQARSEKATPACFEPITQRYKDYDWRAIATLSEQSKRSAIACQALLSRKRGIKDTSIMEYYQKSANKKRRDRDRRRAEQRRNAAHDSKK